MDDFLRTVIQQATAICIECRREFDLFDEEQAAEWHGGHDCEA